jgi:uncharacterized protein (TIGR00369 family)
MPNPIPTTAIQEIVCRGVPLMAAWGVEVLSAETGRAVLRMPYAPQLLRPGGVISGPALMGLADAAMWAALLSLAEGRDESLTSTLSITFLRRVPPRAVLAEACVLKYGRTLAYGEVVLRSEGSEEAVAHVTSTWAVVTPRT